MKLCPACRVGRISYHLANNAWAIFTLWALWLTAEYYGLGPFSYIRIHDLGDSVFPMQLRSIQGFFEHGFSYWFPYAVCGADRVAMGLVDLFRVEGLPFLVLPGWLAYGIVTFLQRFLAGYFTYRLCRDSLKLDRLPSIVAGLAYSISFSELLYGAAHHAMLYGGFAGEMGFPFILWALERIAKKEGIARYLFAFLLGLLGVFSSSFALSVPFILPMALAWFVLVRRQYSFRFLCLYAVFAATLVLGKTPTIWAMLANAPLSHRAQWGAAPSEGLLAALLAWTQRVIAFGLSWVRGAAFRLNYLYWELGLAGFLWSRLRERSLLWILLLLGFCGSISGFWKSFSPLINPYMGFMNGYQFDRFYNLVPFFSAICVGYGLHLLFNGWCVTRTSVPSTKKWSARAVLCAIAIAFLVVHSFQIKIYYAEQWITGISYAVTYENADLQHLADNVDSAPFRVATIADGLHPGYANAYGLETVDGYVVMYPQRYQDYWGKVIEPLTSQDEYLHHYFHDWGNRIYLFSPSDGSFDKLNEIPFSEYYNLNLLSLANTEYVVSTKPIVDERLTLLPSQIPLPETARDDLSTAGKIERGLENNFGGRALFIYRNEDCLPRFFLAERVEIFNDSSQLLDAMAESDIERLRTTAFIEDEFASGVGTEKLNFAEGRVVVSEYSPDCIRLAVELDGSSILVISNSYSPYWIAKVDGVEKEVFPVDHCFSGVYLERDSRIVVLEYRPPYFSPY